MKIEILKPIPCADSRDGSIPPGVYEVMPGEVYRNNRPTDGYRMFQGTKRRDADTWGWRQGLADGRIKIIDDMSEVDAQGEALMANQRNRRER